jgi:hypothetical protein
MFQRSRLAFALVKLAQAVEEARQKSGSMRLRKAETRLALAVEEFTRAFHAGTRSLAGARRPARLKLHAE